MGAHDCPALTGPAILSAGCPRRASSAAAGRTGRRETERGAFSGRFWSQRPRLLIALVDPLQTQPWYYVPLLATFAPALDATLGRPRPPGWRIARLLCGGHRRGDGAARVAAGDGRRTNADIVASRSQGSRDWRLILVAPGTTVSASVGTTRGRSVDDDPPLDDLRIQRYDLLRQRWRNRTDDPPRSWPRP